MKRIMIGYMLWVMGLPAGWTHDFWIQPTTFFPNSGEEVGIHLRVGQHFQGEAVVRMSNWTDRFEFMDGNTATTEPVGGVEWSDPAGVVSIRKLGLYAVGFQSHHQAVVIDPATFAFYLQEEGLESILSLRESRGESRAKGNEVFLRCCKALISSGGVVEPGYDYRFGFKLEIIPQKNPLSLEENEALPLQLLYMGEPLEGALIAALEKSNPMQRVTARTDSNGRAVLRLPQKGHWLIKAVHMIEVTQEKIHADWQSFWASLVFRNDGLR